MLKNKTVFICKQRTFSTILAILYYNNQEIMKIKTKLYRMYETVSLDNIDTYDVEIREKMLHYEIPDVYPIGPGENEDRFYIYEKNKAYFMYIRN